MNPMRIRKQGARPARPGPVKATAVVSLPTGISLLAAACSSSGQSAPGSAAAKSKHLHLAYFAFSQQNGYEAPRRGRVSYELVGADITEERILTAALTDVREHAEGQK